MPLRREAIGHLYEAGEKPAQLHRLPLDCAPLRSSEAALSAARDDFGGAPPIVGGLRPVALRKREPGKVVEGSGDVGVLRTERLLVYGKGAFAEWLGLGVAALSEVEPGEIIEANGDVGMLRAKRLLPNGER